MGAIAGAFTHMLSFTHVAILGCGTWQKVSPTERTSKYEFMIILLAFACITFTSLKARIYAENFIWAWILGDMKH